MGKYPNIRRCRNCGKKDNSNLTNRYCSEKCKEEKEKSRQEDNGDSGNYFDNFVDGKRY